MSAPPGIRTPSYPRSRSAMSDVVATGSNVTGSPPASQIASSRARALTTARKRSAEADSLNLPGTAIRGLRCTAGSEDIGIPVELPVRDVRASRRQLVALHHGEGLDEHV